MYQTNEVHTLPLLCPLLILHTSPPPPPTTALRRKATHTHTHLLDEVCTYVWYGAPIYVRNIPPFEYMILGSFRRSYCGIKWVQVIFVILIHSLPYRSQKPYQMTMQDFGGKDGGKTEMWMNTQAKNPNKYLPHIHF